MLWTKLRKKEVILFHLGYRHEQSNLSCAYIFYACPQNYCPGITPRQRIRVVALFKIVTTTTTVFANENCESRRSLGTYSIILVNSTYLDSDHVYIALSVCNLNEENERI